MRLMWMAILCGTVVGGWDSHSAMGMPGKKPEHTRTSSLKRTFSFYKTPQEQAKQQLCTAFKNAFPTTQQYYHMEKLLTSLRFSSNSKELENFLAHWIFPEATASACQTFKKNLESQPEILFSLAYKIDSFENFKGQHPSLSPLKTPPTHQFFQQFLGYIRTYHGDLYRPYKIVKEPAYQELITLSQGIAPTDQAFQVFYDILKTFNLYATVPFTKKEKIKAAQSIQRTYQKTSILNRSEEKTSQIFSDILKNGVLGKQNELFHILFSGEKFLHFLGSISNSSQKDIYTCLLTFVEHVPCDTATKSVLLALFKDRLQEAQGVQNTSTIKQICKNQLQILRDKLAVNTAPQQLNFVDNNNTFEAHWSQSKLKAQTWVSFFESLRAYINTHYPQEYQAYQIAEKAKQAAELLLPGFTTAFSHEKAWQRMSTALNKLEEIQFHQNNNALGSSQKIFYTLTFQENEETQKFSKEDALVYSGLEDAKRGNPKMLAQRAFYAERFLNFFPADLQFNTIEVAQTAWVLFGPQLPHDQAPAFFSQLYHFVLENKDKNVTVGHLGARFYERFNPSILLSEFGIAWEQTAQQTPLITAYFRDLVSCVKTHYPEIYETVQKEEMGKHQSFRDSGIGSSSDEEHSSALPPKKKTEVKPPVPPRGATLPLSKGTEELLQRVGDDNPLSTLFPKSKLPPKPSLKTFESSQTLPHLPSTTSQTSTNALKRSSSFKSSQHVTFALQNLPDTQQFSELWADIEKQMEGWKDL